MDHLHWHISSNLAAKRMCITRDLLFCSKSPIPMLRRASDSVTRGYVFFGLMAPL